MKYRLRPVDVEAMQFTGRPSFAEVGKWMGGGGGLSGQDDKLWYLRTPEGWAPIAEGEWIIKRGEGEFWRCPDKEFKEEYEPRESEA